ncbi:MAG: hypothetical protein WAO41_03005 [Candidatus Nanopelagicales bacterium]
MVYAATGIGSMPGVEVDEQTRIISGELPDLPHIAELPGRGPGADMIGRTAGLLCQISSAFAIETTPSGWRLCDQPGRVMRRAQSWLGEDCDSAQHHFFGANHIKLQVCGAWTMAASIDMRNGERALRDHAFCADLGQVLVDAVLTHMADIKRRLPDAKVWVQIDEPLLPAVIAARIRTASGLATYRAIDAPRVQAQLEALVSAIHDHDASVVVHCCAPNAPVALARASGADAVAVDLGEAHPAMHDDLAQTLDSGGTLFLGAIDTKAPVSIPAVTGDQPSSTATAVARNIQRLIQQWGFDTGTVGPQVVLTPACGLANQSEVAVRHTLAALRHAGRLLRDETAGDGGLSGGSRDQ